MSHVCHSWRVHLLGLKRLWREIAFSVQNKPTGVRLSTLFLARVKDSDVPLRIYAGLPFGDRQDPTIIDLLLKLRVHTDRWETFQYCGRLGPYNPYLDLPAPKLQYFSDHHDLSHLYSQKTTPLFAGYAPNLRSLTTSFLEGWQPATLANLRVLDLWDCKAEFSIGSLLSVLRNTPQLEEINITSPSPIHDCPPSQVVPLHNLKNLQVKNPDFYSIIGHLTIPNVRIATVSSVYNRGISGVPVRPAFEAVHPFVGLASMAARLPMITEPITLVSLDIQVTSSGFTFTISICTENNRILHVDLEWTGGVEILGWVRYIQRSISALAEMCFLPGASLQVTVPTDGFPINYNNPLFRLSTIEHLTVEGEKLPKVLKVLGSCRPLLLPHLKTLVVPEEELSEKTILSIPKFLQLRRNLAVALDTDNHMNLLRLLNRICSIEGGSTSSDIIYITIYTNDSLSSTHDHSA